MKDLDEVYQVGVVATMSSGKSTFINSLIGKEILTARNTACTGNVVEILNNNTKTGFEATITDFKNKTSKIKVTDSNYVSDFNDNKIKDLSLEGNFFKIKNSDKKLMLIDTPGVNNSQDGSHMQKTYDFLNSFKKGMLIYIINATQFGIEDDYKFLNYVASVLKGSPDLEIVILVNKIDEINFTKEDINKFLEKVDNYIKNIGIRHYKLIPVATLAALLFRKILNGEGDSFTIKERMDFNNSFKFWSNNKMIKREFLTFIPQKCESQKVFFEDEEFESEDLEEAIYNTGITIIEDLISKHLKNEELDDMAKKEEIKINVISTMSAGKSTLINSIIGRDVLPSSNIACTTTITNIKNIDSDKIYLECRDTDNRVVQKRICADKDDLKEYNQDERVMYMDIDCKIDGLQSNNKNIVLVDIPGPNNSHDRTYREVRDTMINSKDKDVILFVMNVTQLETNDEHELLKAISDAMKKGGKQSRDRFIFVVNKCDELDPEAGEKLDGIMIEVKEYLNQFGIENPNIFPITAQLAKAIRMYKNGEELVRFQKRVLNEYDVFIECEDLHFEKFASLTSSLRRKLEERIEEAKRNNDDYEIALIHSGVPALEMFIEEYIDSLDGLNSDSLINKDLDVSISIDKEVAYNNKVIQYENKKGKKKGANKKMAHKKNQGNHNKKNVSRSKVELVYNPYKKESLLTLDGKELGAKFESIKKERIQFYLLEGKNWGGLIPELKKSVNEDFDMTFTGRKIDFEDLEIVVEQYNKVNNTKINLNHIEAKNDSDIISRIDEVVQEFQKGPIKELKEKAVLDQYEKMKNQEFDINVIATMSAGKSTLINSILGLDILPSANEACTATITRIKNSDDTQVYAECRDKNNNLVHKRQAVKLDELEEYNKDARVMYMNVECKMNGISSKNMKLVLVDTPGPNNSQDSTHKEITNTIINDKDKSVVLYVMNGTQLKINDDCVLLKEISEAMKRGGKQSRDRFIFVINKCDQFNLQKESLEKSLDEIKKYLNTFGIENPNIFPITAQLAKIIRKVNNKEEIDMQEEMELNKCSMINKYDLFHFEKFASLTPSSRKKINEKIEKAKKNNDDYELALIHSGVPAVEETIKEYLAKYAYPIKIEQAIKSFKSIIDEKQMLGSLDEVLSKSNDSISELQNQISFVEEKLLKGEEAHAIKEEINKFTLDEESFDDIEIGLDEKLSKLTEAYQGKEYYDEEKAKREIKLFEGNVEKIAKELEAELKRTINHNVIRVGEDLIEKYKEYLKDFENDINIGGFTFEKMNSIQKVKLNNVEELIEKNSKQEDVMGEKIIKAEKSFWKPWSWFRSDTVEKVKVGEKTKIHVYKVLSESIGRIMQYVNANILSAKAKAQSDIVDLRRYFEGELRKLDEKILEIMEDLKNKTNSKTDVEKRLEQTKESKVWLESIIKELNSIMDI